MAKPVVITADSTCDLSAELKERFDIKVIPLTIVLGEQCYRDGIDFSPKDMYERYEKDGSLPKTSAVSYQEFLDFFRPFTEAGYEVVHISISSELSGTFNNARLAAAELEGVYPVDSRMLSSGVALLVLEGADMRDKGMAAAEIAAKLEQLTAQVDTSFVLDTLEYMWKGGRCSSVAALGANILKLKPALEMSQGKLQVYKKYRGAMANVYKQYVKERLAGKKLYGNRVFITQSGGVDESQIEDIEQLIAEQLGQVEIYRAIAGCTISAHCGPGTLGVLFIKE